MALFGVLNFASPHNLEHRWKLVDSHDICYIRYYEARPGHPMLLMVI